MALGQECVLRIGCWRRCWERRWRPCCGCPEVLGRAGSSVELLKVRRIELDLHPLRRYLMARPFPSSVLVSLSEIESGTG